MGSGLSATLTSFGTVLLSFGLVFLVITLLGARYGTPHDTGGMVSVAFLVGGAILFGAGFMLNRSAESRPK